MTISTTDCHSPLWDFDRDTNQTPHLSTLRDQLCPRDHTSVIVALWIRVAWLTLRRGIPRHAGIARTIFYTLVKEVNVVDVEGELRGVEGEEGEVQGISENRLRQ